jgi:hypothetical protein
MADMGLQARALKSSDPGKQRTAQENGNREGTRRKKLSGGDRGNVWHFSDILIYMSHNFWIAQDGVPSVTLAPMFRIDPMKMLSVSSSEKLDSDRIRGPGNKKNKTVDRRSRSGPSKIVNDIWST